MSVTTLRAEPARNAEEWQLREELAAAFQLAARMGWNEGVANHFSVALPGPGNRFLMNPRWRHFARITAESLLLLDADDESTMDRPDAPDTSAWCIHGRIHATLPHARCVLHLHPTYATALASLADPTIPPIDQNSARYFRRVAVDLDYTGVADRIEEGNRLAGVLGDKSRMMMGNHGVLVAAATVAEAFDDMYYLERSCRTVMLAYASGRTLNVMSDEVAENTARAWDRYHRPQALVHFEELRTLLREQTPIHFG
jgi:ribulose-5-phosphate 4-epimerase/fuculose-1-phosphate aldolase